MVINNAHLSVLVKSTSVVAVTPMGDNINDMDFRDDACSTTTGRSTELDLPEPELSSQQAENYV